MDICCRLSGCLAVWPRLAPSGPVWCDYRVRRYDNDAPKPENYLNIPGVETLAGEKVALTTDDDSDDTDAEDLETDEGGATELRNHHVEFQKIVDKYDLKNEDRAERLAWFLTNTDNVTVTVRARHSC